MKPTAVHSIHAYEVRPRKDRRGVDLISEALPFGRLWYGGPAREPVLPYFLGARMSERGGPARPVACVGIPPWPGPASQPRPAAVGSRRARFLIRCPKPPRAKINCSSRAT